MRRGSESQRAETERELAEGRGGDARREVPAVRKNVRRLSFLSEGRRLTCKGCRDEEKGGNLVELSLFSKVATHSPRCVVPWVSSLLASFELSSSLKVILKSSFSIQVI